MRGMSRRLKRKLMIGIAAAAVLAGATAAVVMASQSSTHRHRSGTLATAAGYLGVSEAELRSELSSGKSLAEVANATNGKSATGLIDTLEASQKQKLAAAEATLSSRITAEVNQPRGLARRHGGGQTQAAVAYLGLNRKQLRAELRSGKTLAQLASATSGKSEAGLIEALLAAKKTALQASVTAGTITQAQANARLSKLAGRLAARVKRAKPGAATRG
jgi:hypothetical protein